MLIYNHIEKECQALVFAVQNLWHYQVGQSIHEISKINLVRLLMTKPSALDGHLAKWALLVSLPYRSTKGEVIADFPKENPRIDRVKLY